MAESERRHIEARWDAVMALFGDAFDASPDEREQLLASRETTDAALVQEVRSLLAAHASQGDRFARPALALMGDELDDLMAPPSPSLEGTTVGVYAVQRKVGEGGMGAVYEAIRVGDTYQQRVALKTISRGADSRSVVLRFRRERQILAGLQHPNIAAMFDGGMTDAGTPYLVMEFVDGLPIDAWCAQQQLTIAERLDLFRQVCGAVQHAHRRLVVHRDIKPGNVLVNRDGVVKLLDFGIAKLVASDSGDHEGGSDSSVTRDGLTPLTTAYASPEQARGEPVSTASDVYSLGVVLYQLLAGVSPFQLVGRTPSQILAAVASDTPLPPSDACTDDAALHCGLGTRARLSRALAGELDAMVTMAMRKEPERRYASAEALADDVHRYLKGLPVTARPDTLGYRARKFVERRRALVIMAGITVVASAAFTAFAVREAGLAREEAARTLRISEFMQSVLGAGDVTGLDGSLPRVGPRASVSALLDSALKRVPQQFPDDPAIRARLYRTLGSSLITQSRMREASAVLDSAIALSRSAYGATSLEFALASNEAATAALHRNLLPRSRALALDAQRALQAQHGTGTELYAQTLVSLASIALVEGEYATMDSLASRALALETTRTAAPTLAKASAYNRLGSALLVRNQLDSADAMYRRALATLDAMHASSSLERMDILGNLIGTNLDAGKLAQADSIAAIGMPLAASVFGNNSREFALMSAYQSIVRGYRGHLDASMRASDEAMHIVDSIPEIVGPVRSMVLFARATPFIARQQWSVADSLLARAAADLSTVRKGIGLCGIALYRGIARAMLRDFPESERQLQAAERIYRESGIVRPGMLGLIHQSLAALYTRMGQPAQATPYYAFLDTTMVKGIKAYAAREHAADSAALAGTRR